MSLIEANLHWRYTDGDIVAPWYTLPALQWLKDQPTKDWIVFEYGAGYSTVWWRLNCASLCGIESNKNWADAVKCDYDGRKYEYVISIYRNFNKHSLDCIIVDGIYREECVEYCLKFIKPGGYLIIDNYGSEDYDIERTADLLKDWPVTLHKQPNHSSWVTAVFQKP